MKLREKNLKEVLARTFSGMVQSIFLMILREIKVVRMHGLLQIIC